MATFIMGDVGVGINMSDVGLEGLFDYDHTTAKPTYLRLYDDGANYFEFGGSGLSYKFSGGLVSDVSGSVHSLTQTFGGTKAISVTGLNLDAHALATTVFGLDDKDFVTMITAGSDSLSGSRYADILLAGAGKDTIYGGLGADHMTGGTGADTFVFKQVKESTASAMDGIRDFSVAQKDHIDLKAIDASTKAAGNQAFTFVGTSKFDGKAGELRYEKHGSDAYVYGDVDGDKKADFVLHLDHITKVTADFFFL